MHKRTAHFKPKRKSPFSNSLLFLHFSQATKKMQRNSKVQAIVLLVALLSAACNISSALIDGKLLLSPCYQLALLAIDTAPAILAVHICFKIFAAFNPNKCSRVM